MYINRLIQKTLKDALKTFPVVLITGPRQSGKTTLVKEVLGKRFNYVSLDEIDIRSLAADDPRTFLKQYPNPVIIDEIQNVGELLSYIKALVDQDRKPGQWVLTGSQQFSLMRNISESLAGRVAILNLYPFSLSEINKNFNIRLANAESYIKHLLNLKGGTKSDISVGKWLLLGGYPELIVKKNIIKKLWFSSYVQTYIDRDVRGNIKNNNLNDFERFVKILASMTGQELKYSIISRQIGVSIPTIKSWVSFLEASSIIYLLYPYQKNFKKRVIKSPKCYFVDTGLASFLVGLQDEKHLLQGPMSGALFETACIMQFVKRFSALMDNCSLYFYRSIDGHEVDLLIETADKVYPIEIKLSSTIKSRHADNIKVWLDLSGDKEGGKGLVISTSEYNGFVADNVKNCHFSLLT